MKYIFIVWMLFIFAIGFEVGMKFIVYRKSLKPLSEISNLLNVKEG